MNATFVVLIIVVALAVVFGGVYAGLLASNFLFGWPDVVTWKHTLAAWVVLVILGNLFRRK